jgi:hypothetical protein
LQLFRDGSLTKAALPVTFAPGRLMLATRPNATGCSADGKDDGYGGGRCLRGQRCDAVAGYDHGYAAADEIGRERRQPIILTLRLAVYDRHILALDIAGFRLWRNGTVKFL